MEQTAGHPAEETLTALALGEGGEDAAGHVAGCPECARFVEDMRLARAAVARLADEDVPASIAERIMRGREERHGRHGVRGAAGGRRGRVVLWLSVALIVAMLVAAYLLYVSAS